VHPNNHRFIVILFAGCSILVFPNRNTAGADCETAMSTVEMLRCEDAEYKDATQELSRVYKQLNKVMTERQRKALEAANTAWMACRKAYCTAATLMYEGGSTAPVVSITCASDLTKEHLKELRGRCGWNCLN
jgi:uncharacterized protein YecT (DUF1311 family)